jgi:two-component system response regulator VanR
VIQRTVLLVDDEQLFLEALEDALVFAKHRVLKARDVATALEILRKEKVDLITIDVMLSPGPALESTVSSQLAGLYLCEKVVKEYPLVSAFCLSVVNDPETIKRIRRLGIQFLRKGETPLRTVLSMINVRLAGIEDAERYK